MNYKNLLNKITIESLLVLYIISIGFTDVINLPVIGRKIQTPEIIFVFIIFAFIGKLIREQNILSVFQMKWRLLDFGILAYVSSVIVSCFTAYCQSCWFDVIGTIYLIGIYLFIRLLLEGKTVHLYKYFEYAFVRLGVFVAISGIIGWILTQFNIPNILAWPTGEYYPYLGYIGRASGFTRTPGMLASILTICTIWKVMSIFQKGTFKIKDFFILSLYAIALFLSFSKAVILLMIALILLFIERNFFVFRYQFIKVIAWSIIPFLFLFFIVATHFLLVDTTDPIKNDSIFQGRFASERAVIEVGDKWTVHSTPYFELKKIAITVGQEHFPLGIGSGCFRDYLEELRLRPDSSYPSEMWAYDPHSSVFGSFGELGFLGFLGFLFFFYSIFFSLKKINKNKNNLLIREILLLCFIYFLLESVSTDIMNFRLLWVLLGILSAATNKEITE